MVLLFFSAWILKTFNKCLIGNVILQMSKHFKKYVSQMSNRRLYDVRVLSGLSLVHLVETAGLLHQHRWVSEAAVLSCGLYNTVSLGHIMPPWQPTSMFCVNNKLSWRKKTPLFNLNDHFALGSACLYLCDCKCTTALPPSDTNPSETWRTRPLTLDPRLILKHRPDKYFLLIFKVRMSVGQLFLCKASTLLVQKHQYIAWYCKLVIFFF